MTWRGNWPGDWVGDWQGAGGASPFANMALRVTASATVTGSLEAVSGSGSFADMALLVSGGASITAALAGAQEAQPIASGGSWALSPSRKRRDVVSMQMVAASRATVSASLEGLKDGPTPAAAKAIAKEVAEGVRAAISRANRIKQEDEELLLLL